MAECPGWGDTHTRAPRRRCRLVNTPDWLPILLTGFAPPDYGGRPMHGLLLECGFWAAYHRAGQTMPELPRGTVTFLFTDLEGSTRLWDRYPDATRQAVTRHDAL